MTEQRKRPLKRKAAPTLTAELIDEMHRFLFGNGSGIGADERLRNIEKAMREHVQLMFHNAEISEQIKDIQRFVTEERGRRVIAAQQERVVEKRRWQLVVTALQVAGPYVLAGLGWVVAVTR